MRIWREDSPGVGRIAVYVVPLMALGVASINLYHSWSDRDNLAWHLQRARLLSEIGRQEGKQLIVVKYGPHHSYFREWVYNDADIDGSKVVWARAMDSQEDCKLVEYFKDRKPWSLAIDHDEAPVRLEPLPTESCH